MAGIQLFAPFRHVAHTLHGHIEAGLYLPGEKLPTLARLAELFGVKRCVVRNALSLLHKDGVVVSRNGRGHYVSSGRDVSASVYDLPTNTDTKART